MKEHFHQKGSLKWIGLRISKSKSVQEVSNAELVKDHGLSGDKAGQRKGSKRQVSLIQEEYFPVIESFMNCTIQPSDLRRNLVISGINLSILKDYQIRIADAVLTITGNCAPCRKMEEVLGYGGFNAMRNHGGVTATVLQGGIISVGDEVEVITAKPGQVQLL